MRLHKNGTTDRRSRMIKCCMCGAEASRKFVSYDLANLEADHFALCHDHKEALYEFLVPLPVVKEVG